MHGDDRDGHAIALIDAMARLLLDRGFDVIIEGILNAALYTESLVRLVGDHGGVSRSYIWDLPFEETVRRHATKPVPTEFGEAELRQWWRGFQPVEGLGESVLGPTDDLGSSIARIAVDCWGAETDSQS
ncbi:hypothetical protein FOE78_04750 [Microlunatus elymi]|uniref:Uncharacterized protein n=1 Tax=Microlunatus elymi TaxID=2596828 RepID=A0A516PWH9_9ACTN|nr:hypothetical protein [Microlunatus elymi]QDP95311.1 hypothetical protein FOE78_04750 [Microlunatus elymi]